MNHITKILFPTDFSGCSQQALNHALFLAEEHGAALHLLHAIVLHSDVHDEMGAFPEAAEIYDRVAEVARGRSADLVERHAADTLEIKEVQRRGVAAAEVILDYAREQGVELIVLGTHGRRGLGRLFLGSVAEEVVRLAPCAVLTLRQQDEPRPAGRFDRILVPMDFSEPSRRALDSAAELARRYGASLELVHVFEPPAYPQVYYPGSIPTAALDLNAVERQARQTLEDLVRDLDLAGKAKVHVVEGYPATAITELAEEKGADLIVISTHGHAGLSHLLLGSVTEKVVRLAECPVLTVRPPEAES